MIKKLSVIAIGVLGTAGVAGLVNAKADKVWVCHETSSINNPVVLISVSSNAVQAHLDHGDTLLPEGASDCSGGGPVPE
jgi:hypothetical protein